MNFRFLIPGKCREEYINSGVKEYIKRLGKYGKVTLSYLPEEALPEKPNPAQIEKALDIEGQRALRLIKSDEVLFLIDIHGKKYTTDSFSDVIRDKTSTCGNLAFLFGSSYGLSNEVRKRADVKVSLSDFTFTHYMALLLVVEQVYRSMKILHGEAYDK